ncbi:hypothetical protein ACB092_05G283200 [Castanea dentata]
MYCFFFIFFRSVFAFGQTSIDSITIFGDLCYLNYSSHKSTGEEILQTSQFKHYIKVSNFIITKKKP